MIYRAMTAPLARISRGLPYAVAYLYTRLISLVRRVMPGILPLPIRPVAVMGLSFPNPVGLAAGFDRTGRLSRDIAAAGLGFIEVGTVNANASLLRDPALRRCVRNLRRFHDRRGDGAAATPRPLVGISLGSLRDPEDELAILDIQLGMTALWRYVDYLVINLSRPGSPLRSSAAGRTEVFNLLQGVKQRYDALLQASDRHVPIVIKVLIEPRAEGCALPVAALIARELNFDGVLAAFEQWPERGTVEQCIAVVAERIRPLPLIAVGGIRTAADARRALTAGAALVQIYTALVRKGPLGVRRISSGLGDGVADCPSSNLHAVQ